ncbi:MAG: hypothetical protein IPO92_10085 [Saprospiraceae bacterium]|nr:hypothetical protein [Saprospiraceae bacterium]
MKTNILILLITLCFACKETKVTEAVNNEAVIHFDWLAGNWQRSNEEAGQTTYEQWLKANDSLYIGMAYTMKLQDTIWRENVKLMKVDTSWVFSVIGKGETMPTDFVLTNITASTFTCENPVNEFPKKISYAIVGDSLKAMISGGGPDIAFLFGRK